MKKVIIGFSRYRGFSILSSLIRAIEQTDYSHVYIRLYSDRYERDLVYQASGLAVNFVGLGHFMDHNLVTDEFEFEISDENYTKMMQFAIDNAGVPYGKKQLIGMGIRKLGQWLGTNWENPYRDGKQTYVCSEIAAYIIKDYISGAIGTDLDDMDPRSVHRYLSQIRQ